MRDKCSNYLFLFIISAPIWNVKQSLTKGSLGMISQWTRAGGYARCRSPNSAGSIRGAIGLGDDAPSGNQMRIPWELKQLRTKREENQPRTR